jgi:rare lipoprotein A
MRARICTMLVALTLAACSSTRQSDQAPHSAVSLSGVYKLGTPYQINGRWYYPKYDPNYDEVGVASWYGDAFHGRLTANGEIFDKDTISAAHPTLPLPSYVRVTDLDNGRSMVIRVNDRGPFVDDRLIDLSEAAARNLGFRSAGLARVRVAFLDLAEARGTPPLPTVSPPPVEVAQAPAKPRTAPERPVAAVPKMAPRDVEGSLQLASSGPTVEPKVGWG